jgi:hypothetical protein
MAKVTTFSIDEKTEQTLSEIRESIGATSNTEVLRRAVMLMGVASKVIDQNGKLIIQDKDGKNRELLIT